MSERKVIIYKYEKVKGQSHYEKVPEGHGIFHKWGVDFEEFEAGPGNYSTAIVELCAFTTNPNEKRRSNPSF